MSYGSQVLRLFLLFTIFSTSSAAALPTPPPNDDYIIAPIPKCGTYLLRRCLELMRPTKFANLLGGCTQRLIDSLQSAKDQGAVLHCYHYDAAFASYIGSQGYKCIFQFRDPRDACVSLVFYMDRFPGLIKRDFYQVSPDWDELSFDEKLLTVITGERCPSYMECWYELIAQWAHYPNVLAVRFEDLIGAKGGGDDFIQKKTINAISRYLYGRRCRRSHYKHIAENLYHVDQVSVAIEGKEFVGGKIGSWKLFFKETHKEAFKERYNGLLQQLGYENDANW